MVKRVNPKKVRNKGILKSLPTSINNIYSLPDDLLEVIAIILQTERQFASLSALDQTSKRFSAVCKQVLWQDVTLKSRGQWKRLMKDKFNHLREMVQYLQVWSDDANWFWNDLGQAFPNGVTHDYLVHRAFPNIRCVTERFKETTTKDTTSGSSSIGSATTSGWKIGVSISVRNHLDDNASTLRTISKAFQAILNFSDTPDQTLTDYVDGITSFPKIMTRTVPDLKPITREVYLDYVRQVTAQSTVINRLCSSPAFVEKVFSNAYDSFRSGQWDPVSDAAKAQFYGMIENMGANVLDAGFLVDLEGVGSTPIHLLTNRSSVDPQHDLVTVVDRLFRQMVAVFSTPTNVECHAPMVMELLCHSFALAEAWCKILRRPE